MSLQAVLVTSSNWLNENSNDLIIFKQLLQFDCFSHSFNDVVLLS